IETEATRPDWGSPWELQWCPGELLGARVEHEETGLGLPPVGRAPEDEETPPDRVEDAAAVAPARRRAGLPAPARVNSLPYDFLIPGVEDPRLADRTVEQEAPEPAEDDQPASLPIETVEEPVSRRRGGIESDLRPMGHPILQLHHPGVAEGLQRLLARPAE